MLGPTLKCAAGLLLVVGAAAGCQDAREPTGPALVPVLASGNHTFVTPVPLVPVTFGASSITLWPYTGNDLAGTKVDPINILFPGRGDPRQIRAVLLSLSGNRSPMFPNVAPFNCVWKDALGGSNQTGFTEGSGWVGSSIQLTCGDYTVRYHLRLFPVGDWTVGGAHFEVNIPGTQEHESMSWDRARELVLYDFVRSGLLVTALPMLPLPVGTLTPTYRTIRPEVWFPLKAAQPALAAYINPVEVGPNDVRIPNDGFAMAINLASTPAVTPMDETSEYDIPMGQMIPKPFCSSGPLDYVYVSGVLHVSEHTVVGTDSSYHNHQQMKGNLDITPMNPLTQQPTGETYKAMIDNTNTSLFTDQQSIVTLYTRQATSPAGTAGMQIEDWKVGPGNSTGYSKTTRCD